MAKNNVNLKVNISTDTVNEDIYVFGDTSAPMVDNSGIHKMGGITNLYETKTTLPAGKNFYTDDGSLISASTYSTDLIDVQIDGKSLGQIPAYGIESKTEVISAYDDVAITSDNTYITAKLTGTIITIYEFSLNGVQLNTRTINFVNIGNISQFLTSFSFVRKATMHYSDSLEFALRLGDQIAILQESNPNATIAKYLQSSNVLGTGNNILCSIIYNNVLVFAGAGGRVGSFDGVAWRNYDGSGTGTGPYNTATVIGTSNINAMTIFNGTLIVAGDGGKLGSFDSVAWKNSDGTGAGLGVSDNATLIGTNNIKCLAVLNTNILVVGGVGGRIGCINITTKYVYTTATTAPMTGSTYPPVVSNAVVCGANDINAMTIITQNGVQVLCVGSNAGLIASYDSGWITSGSVLTPTLVEGISSWTARTLTTGANGNGWSSAAYGNGVFVVVANTTIGPGSVMTSFDGINWLSRTGQNASGNGWKSVCFGGGQFVAIAATTSTTGAVMTSPDGITWTARTSPATVGSGWNSVTWGNGVFVAISNTSVGTNAVMTSPDGITWTIRNCQAGNGNWKSVTYGNGLFVAVAQTTLTTGAVQTSPDGITWTLGTCVASASPGWQSVTYGNGQFVAVSLASTTAGAIMTSPDGITWTARTSIAGPGGWISVTYGNGLFVAVGNTNSTTVAIQTSPDGITWTSRVSPAPSGAWMSIAYGNGQFVIVSNSTTTTGAVITSLMWNGLATLNQGATAQLSTAATGSGWRSVAYGNGIFVACAITTSTSGAIQTSPDGINWTAQTSTAAAGFGWYSVTYGNGIFVACATTTSTSGAIQTSPDGINWTARTSTAASGSGWQSVTYGNGLFVCVAITTSTTGAIQTSPDGINWTARTSTAATGSGWRSVAYGNGLFVCVASTTLTAGAIQTSPDGITWTAQTSTAGSGGGWQSVTYGNGLFVCVAITTSTSGAIQTSPDGINWTARTSTAATGGLGWYSITYGNGLFVCVAQTTSSTGAIQTSPDGINWTARTSTAATGSGWRSVAYGNGLFVVISATTLTNGAIQTIVPWTDIIAKPTNTIVSTDNITALGVYNNSRLIVGSSAGKVASWDGYWTTYSGTGSSITQPAISNNATAIGGASINKITQIGSNLIIAGDNSRIASWDGTNWHNYDNTGTGTGPYSSTIIGTNSIRGVEFYLGQIIASGLNGTVNSMTTNSVVSPFYSVGGNPVAQSILVGQFSAGYLDAYKYENGLYLLGVVNNNLNQYYVLDKSSLNLTLLKGKYAWLQVSGGKSRHIITETPRFDGSRMYAMSTVGYTDFINFSASQVYPSDTQTLTSFSNYQYGWNYSDITYKLTSSATSVFNLLGPIPTPTTPLLYKVFQSNTNTLTTSYAKLTNGAGVTPTKPFEIRLNWLNAGLNTTGAQSYLSVASLDGRTTDALGVIVSEVGAFDDTYTPQIMNDDTILWKNQGNWNIVKISKNVSNRIQRIDSTLYKINTISPLNIIDTISSTIQVGSTDYQGRMLFNSTAVPSVVNTKVVAVYTGKYSNSIDNGDKLIQIPTPSMNNIDLIGFRIPNTNRSIINYSIDTFFNDIYAYTTFNDGSELVLSDPPNPIYLTNTNLPVPIGYNYINGAVTSTSSTIFLSPNYDGYQIGNNLSNAIYTPMTLFGQLYLFDGLSIYQANVQDNIFTGTVKLCDAYGMIFIAQTPIEVFFLSTFDNSLYSFNGGRTLNKSKAFTTLDTIIQGTYSTKDAALLLEATDSLIWVRDSIVTKQAKKVDQTNLHLQTTSKGTFLYNDQSSWQYTYFPQAGAIVQPMTFQTAYFGQLNNQRSVLNEWIVTLYNVNKSVVHINCTEFSKDQDSHNSFTHVFTIKASDWDNRGYAHIRVQPKYQRSLGSSLKVDVVEKCTILDISCVWTDGANAAIAQNKSK